jgi:hypothetical protein
MGDWAYLENTTEYYQRIEDLETNRKHIRNGYSHGGSQSGLEVNVKIF